MSKTIIVTGGTGYIGSHTTVELIEAGYDVVAIDNLSNSTADVLDGIARITGRRPTFYEADCNDREAMDRIFAQHAPVSGIIHFAASKAVGESVHKPLLYYRNNIVSLLNLLELMPRHGVEGIVFSSSCTVYGQPAPSDLPVTEDAPIRPATSPYGNTKQINEEIIRDPIHADAPFRAILLRYFNPIGAHPSAEIGERPAGTPQNLVPYLTQTAAGIRPELRVFGDDYDTPDGTGVRDYIHVMDLASGHVAALGWMNGRSGCETFNLGTGRGTSVLEIVRAFSRACGRELPYVIEPRRAGDVTANYADCSKAREEMGWQARFGIDDMCRDSWNWQSQNPNGYEG